jgi:hypothetical protein
MTIIVGCAAPPHPRMPPAPQDSQASIQPSAQQEPDSGDVPEDCPTFAQWVQESVQQAGFAPGTSEYYEFWEEDQVIITGDATVISTAIDELGLSLEPLATTELGELVNQYLDSEAVANFLPNMSEPVMQLYQITQVPTLGDSTALVVCQISQYSRENAIDIYAEANFITGPHHPHSTEGSPITAPPVEAREVDFAAQWAFEELNVDIMTLPDSVQEVHIGVFDTSPFAGNDVVAHAQPTPLELIVTAPSTAIPPPHPAAGALDVRDHGVFVAGLIHAVAPNAIIHLIRVLEDDGWGNTNTLTAGVYEFLLSQAEFGSLDRTVLNLSLGIRLPPRMQNLNGLRNDYFDNSTEPLLPALRQYFQNESSNETSYVTGFAGRSWPLHRMRTPAALLFLMTLADELNVTMVAAAGNHSTPNDVEEPMIPAAYIDLAVAASTMDQARACFANAGDVAAPGGDARPATGGATDCDLVAHTGCSVSDCAHGLISVVTPATATSATGFAYWAGSSFATALVSGLAARRLGEGVVTGVDEVSGCIHNTATPPAPASDAWALGSGIIDFTSCP